MIQFAWPWMLLFLPLPWLVARMLPAATPQAGAVFLPFAAAVSVNTTLALRSLPTVFKGTHVNDPKVHELRGSTLKISADRPFVVYADGDPIGELPVTVTTLPAAIRIIVPPGGEAPAPTS